MKEKKDVKKILEIELLDRGLSKTKFSTMIGVSYAHLCRVLSGALPITKTMANSIELKLEGKVKAEDLLEKFGKNKE